jgi:hypothetical protein
MRARIPAPASGQTVPFRLQLEHAVAAGRRLPPPVALIRAEADAEAQRDAGIA